MELNIFFPSTTLLQRKGYLEDNIKCVIYSEMIFFFFFLEYIAEVSKQCWSHGNIGFRLILFFCLFLHASHASSRALRSHCVTAIFVLFIYFSFMSACLLRLCNSVTPR